MGCVKEEVVYHLECLWLEKNDTAAIVSSNILQPHHFYPIRDIQIDIWPPFLHVPFFNHLGSYEEATFVPKHKSNFFFNQTSISLLMMETFLLLLYRTTLWIVTFDNTGETNVWASLGWKKITTNSALINSVWTSRCWKRSGSQTRISTMDLAPTCILSPGQTSYFEYRNMGTLHIPWGMSARVNVVIRFRWTIFTVWILKKKMRNFQKSAYVLEFV